MDDNTFLANVEQEGRIDQSARTDEEGKETPLESPAEKKPEDKTASPARDKGEGETPESKKGEPKVFEAFHKHPRWIASQQELKMLREFRERVEPLLGRLGEVPEKREEETKIPAWFIDLFGENTDAWVKYRAYNTEERKQLREEIMSELQEQSRSASEETKKWDKWVEDGLVEIIDDEDIQVRAKSIGFDFSNKDQQKAFRNELLKIALDYQPSDDDNNISLAKAFDILELQKLRKSPEKGIADRKKEIADKTMQKGKPESEAKDYKTPADLRGKSFRDMIPNE